MDTKSQTPTDKKITNENINRVLEVGHLLFSILTPEEIDELQKLLSLPKMQQATLSFLDAFLNFKL